MKYTIEEERLVNLIKKYMDLYVGKVTTDTLKQKDKIWIGKDGSLCFWTNLSNNSFVIDKSLFYNVANMFLIENKKFLVDVMIDWFNSAQSLEQVDKYSVYKNITKLRL